MAERVFRTLKEVKDTFFPNIPLEELEGDISEMSEEEIQERIGQTMDFVRKQEKPHQVDSKKFPR